jgi:hypothetical protein
MMTGRFFNSDVFLLYGPVPKTLFRSVKNVGAVAQIPFVKMLLVFCSLQAQAVMGAPEEFVRQSLGNSPCFDDDPTEFWSGQ